MIIDKILKQRKKRYQQIMSDKPLDELKLELEEFELSLEKPFPFYNVLSDSEQFHFICEFKKASPSKGIINEDIDSAGLAREYEIIGASAISCLTEPDFFQGSDDDFITIRDAVRLPLLRKDFIFSEYQIYEAKLLGANAVLLIVSMLTPKELERFLDLAHELNMDALVECHNAEEIALANQLNARIIGVNNRDLKTFMVDLNNTRRLRELVPEEVIFIAESGVSTRSQVEELEDSQVDALLIGETMMRANDRFDKMNELRGIRV